MAADVPLVAKILVHDEFFGKVWYLIRFTQVSAQKDTFYLKRYEDFKELHWNLEAALKSCPPWGPEAMLRVLPELPELGRWGIMQKISLLGMGDWADRFQESLQAYLDRVLSQITDIEDEPILKAFFGQSPIPMVTEDLRPGVLVRFRGLAERAKSFGGQRFPAAKETSESQELKAGSVVRLVNLRNATAFNGQLAKLVSVDHDRGQCDIQVSDGRIKCVSRSNVRLAEAEDLHSGSRGGHQELRRIHSEVPTSRQPRRPAATDWATRSVAFARQPEMASVADFLSEEEDMAIRTSRSARI